MKKFKINFFIFKIYNGVDLTALACPDALGYALNVCKAIFTKEELRVGIFGDEKNKSRSKTRENFETERTNVLKGKFFVFLLLLLNIIEN